ncbi:hypothetical protein TNCV_4030691 [Trichonephila clavipes]|nr:hypothetical protein TNCV_4030691 [Trichonephila clavipes]
MWSMVAQRLTQITPSAPPPDQLWQRVEASWSALLQEHIQSLSKTMPRRVTAQTKLGCIADPTIEQQSSERKQPSPPTSKKAKTVKLAG